MNSLFTVVFSPTRVLNVT